MTIQANVHVNLKRCAVLMAMVVFVLAVSMRTSAQAPANPQANKDSVPVKTEPGIKVAFDEKSPGIIVVSAGGERVRIDTATKTITPVEEPDAAAEESKETTDSKDAAKATPKPEDEEEEPGHEPYDYRLVNVPTPKIVPRHSLNMYFTHRFTQPLNPVKDSAKTLLGFDSFSVSSIGLFYGITDKLYVSIYRSPLCQTGLCRTIEVGAGYHLFSEKKGKAPVTMALYGSVEGNDNFTNKYTFNLQAQLARSIGKYVNVFFAPAVHLNANGQRRFAPKPEDFFPAEPLAAQVNLGKHTGSFGFGVNARVSRSMALLFEFTPRIGFKLGRVSPIYDANFKITGFKNTSYPEIGFGIEKDVGRHAFSLTFSNTQTTTTSRYNSSNLVLSPRYWVIGFNLFRRMW